MKTIHKHKIKRHMLDSMGGTVIETGADPEVLLVETQRDEDELPTLWVECDSGKGGQLHLYVVATGGYVGSGYRHVGSCVCRWGTLVWHMYVKAELEGDQ